MRRSNKLALLLSTVLLATACSQGADIASPGATNGGTGGGGGVTPPTSGGTLTPGATDACPAGTTNGGTLGVGNGDRFGLPSGTAVVRVCNIQGEVLSNLTLPFLTGLVYRLNGRVDIGRDTGADGASAGGIAATLTIQPRVRIFGSGGSDVLIINRGSQIQANGNASQPIVFTSDIALSTPVAQIPITAFRQWAGLIIVGRAPIRGCATAVNAGSVQCQNQVEGITASTGRPAFYGGATPTDNSGSLQFVQVNYAGSFLPGAAAGDDLNGLTLAGVGSGTTIANVQVNNSGDDGIEIFGGTVDMRNMIVTGAFDDSYDCDEGYTGRTQRMLVIHRRYPAGSGGGPDGFIECSNIIRSAINAGSVQTNPIIANFTFIGTEASDTGASTKGIGVDASLGSAPAAAIRLYNGVVSNNLANIGGTATAGTGARCLSLTQPDTGSGRGDADAANVQINSVLFDCRSTGTGTNPAAALGRIQNGGTNNSGPTTAEVAAAPGQLGYVAASLVQAAAPSTAISLQDFPIRFVNGTNENARAAFNTPSLGAFFSNLSFIGAVQNTSDNWWRGWSCGLEETSAGTRTNTCQ